jgi:hypothetical protein
MSGCMSAANGKLDVPPLRATLALVFLVGTLAALVEPSTSRAAAPTLEITSPLPTEPVRDTTPTVEGTSTDPAYPAPLITVRIFELTGEGAHFVEQLVAEERPAQTWSTKVITKLRDGGIYTAVAEQTEEGQTGKKEVTFTVDTGQPPPPPPPPVVAIAYPLPGTASVGESQLLSGTASIGAPNRPEVTVEVFRGEAASAPAIRSLTVPVVVSGETGRWNGTVGGLPPGTYTARAVQRGDGTGHSAPVTFTLTAPVAGPVTPPTPAFTWFPVAPVVGQSVVLVSSSTDLSSPITSFAWDLLGNGPLKSGGPVLSTSFPSAGDHTVRLQVVDGRGASATASKTIPVSSQPLQTMQPFPIVRIAGVKASYGVKLSALTVQSPVGVRVTVACRGRACKKLRPQSRLATASATNRHASSVVLAFRGFERGYRAGVTLEVRVFAPGEIGKYMSFAIHRRGLPTRKDECLAALDPHPIPCPA